ncbi:hypothetical protein [Massilia sp. Root335]|jgi:hypothetical protein|uniref:hypothetical protein n=1 Tax=Massilia sp. Root335 TaxID=1736517 RepID=UPI0006F849CD|nr:hypothetical protein [Massilia sp. Root335]KQV33200.1 hypothetical protein ASC93_26915 [Massilia sp. Root335]
MTLPRPFAMLLMTILAGCAAAPLHEGVYPLRPEQRVELARGLVLTYDSYSDSRCPANTRCIWAGRLIFRFLLDGPDGIEEFTLGPDQPTAAPAALHGARIVLDTSAIPPARAAGTMRPGDVIPVTLKVSTK